MAKRKRGLGSPPDEHRRLADQHAENAVVFFRNAGQSAQKGNCADALQQFSVASFFEGKSVAHADSAGNNVGAPRSNDRARARHFAEKSLGKRCIIVKSR